MERRYNRGSIRYAQRTGVCEQPPTTRARRETPHIIQVAWCVSACRAWVGGGYSLGQTIHPWRILPPWVSDFSDQILHRPSDLWYMVLGFFLLHPSTIVACGI